MFLALLASIDYVRNRRARTRATESMKAADVLLENREYWRNEKIAFLALSSLKGIGFWTLYKLAKSGVSFKDVLKESGGKFFDKVYDDDDSPEGVARQQDELWQKGLALARGLFSENIRLLFKDESGFPSKLKDIPDAPYWIFVQGDVTVLFRKSVAVVGTRLPSDDGAFLSKLVLATLEKFKCVTVSGLALGVDQLAHFGSLRYGLKTIAVLGTGILGNYPKGSEILRRKILDSGGCIVSEYLPQQSYSAENFIRRNRLQAALCDLLVPVEWGVKSGTAHTVKFAAKYNKPIINLYMPLMYSLRPELKFSEEQYGALSLEMPTNMSVFDDCVYKYLSEDLFFEPVGELKDIGVDEFGSFGKSVPVSGGSGVGNEDLAIDRRYGSTVEHANALGEVEISVVDAGTRKRDSVIDDKDEADPLNPEDAVEGKQFTLKI